MGKEVHTGASRLPTGDLYKRRLNEILLTLGEKGTPIQANAAMWIQWGRDLACQAKDKKHDISTVFNSRLFGGGSSDLKEATAIILLGCTLQSIDQIVTTNNGVFDMSTFYDRFNQAVKDTPINPLPILSTQEEKIPDYKINMMRGYYYADPTLSKFILKDLLPITLAQFLNKIHAMGSLKVFVSDEYRKRAQVYFQSQESAHIAGRDILPDRRVIPIHPAAIEKALISKGRMSEDNAAKLIERMKDQPPLLEFFRDILQAPDFDYSVVKEVFDRLFDKENKKLSPGFRLSVLNGGQELVPNLQIKPEDRRYGAIVLSFRNKRSQSEALVFAIVSPNFFTHQNFDSDGNIFSSAAVITSNENPLELIDIANKLTHLRDDAWRGGYLEEMYKNITIFTQDRNLLNNARTQLLQGVIYGLKTICDTGFNFDFN